MISNEIDQWTGINVFNLDYCKYKLIFTAACPSHAVRQGDECVCQDGWKMENKKCVIGEYSIGIYQYRYIEIF